MKIVPVTHKTAKGFISAHHRHNKLPSITAVFVLGLEDEGSLVGVAMVGYPKARMIQNGSVPTLEVTRVAVGGGQEECQLNALWCVRPRRAGTRLETPRHLHVTGGVRC